MAEKATPQSTLPGNLHLDDHESPNNEEDNGCEGMVRRMLEYAERDHWSKHGKDVAASLLGQ